MHTSDTPRSWQPSASIELKHEYGFPGFHELATAQRLQQASQKLLQRLSRREREVLQSVVASAPNKTIARELGLSVKTVEKHRSNVMRKLQVTSLPDLMRIWLQANPRDLRVPVLNDTSE